MASDASSGDKHKPPPFSYRAAGNEQSTEDAHHIALTQELARLLAATIAQRQSGKPLPGGGPTSTELATLASLIASAGSSQRSLAPVFRDGLSSLSYAPNRPGTQPAAVAEQEDLAPDDEPMPIPSTWRQPAQHDEERWFRQQMGAAVLGLAAGLLIVVPTVLFLSGWLTASQRTKTSAQSSMADLRPMEVKTVKVQVKPVETPPETAAQYVAGGGEGRAQSEPTRPVEPPTAAVALATKAETSQPQIDDVLALARRRIENGDVAAAREILESAEGRGQGPTLFALAETYDPNMLAAWGSRGVTADVTKARALYEKALGAGALRSQARLEALR
jgi:hypothetical protein